MRDSTIIGELQKFYKMISSLERAFKLALTGEAIRAQALQKLLLQKGIVSEVELQQAIGEVIQEANNAAAEESAPKADSLTTPTPDQVAEIAKTSNTDIVVQ
jgi:enoyl-CoA hydratase/carnithine racemase